MKKKFGLKFYEKQTKPLQKIALELLFVIHTFNKISFETFSCEVVVMLDEICRATTRNVFLQLTFAGFCC
jgi:hypothetical protein